MASRRIEDLHPDLQPICREFVRRCEAAGVTALITTTWRSGAEQDELYAQGRTKPGSKVTNARAGQSAHNAMIQGKPAARAFDVVPLVNGKAMWDAKHPAWQTMGRIGMELGLNWYGRPNAPFREFPHFELARGYQ
ncbi:MULTISPECIES: M15 family metallopeptidase [Chromobacterium]|uniref:M15 family metallopeptidase n=1 Tax=Chromobacterium TaxID=535 RepID=UPI000D302263|nr:MULTISPECIES: M15 family metallopeptidase [Chromobacterium]MCP1289761.1 M15 family metallopeptidase [Chromobacterium sp. S0633]PTU70321.1 peptidase M15 [Chromobacterium haemolyticum]